MAAAARRRREEAGSVVGFLRFFQKFKMTTKAFFGSDGSIKRGPSFRSRSTGVANVLCFRRPVDRGHIPNLNKTSKGFEFETFVQFVLAPRPSVRENCFSSHTH